MPGRGYWGATKPPAGVGLDFSHPLARGLVRCLPLNEGAGARWFDHAAQRYMLATDPGGGWRWAASRAGKVIRQAASNALVLPDPTMPLPNTGITIAFLASVLDLSAEAFIFQQNSGTECQLRHTYVDGQMYWDYGGQVGGTSRLQYAPPSGWGGVMRLLVVSAGPNGMTIHDNGACVARNTNAASRAATTTGLTWLGDTSTLIHAGDVAGIWAWGRQLPESQIRAFSAAPFDMFRPPVWRRQTSAQQYLISPSGAVTPTGTLVKRDNKVAAGTITPTGALIPLGVKPKSMSGTVTPAGVLAQRANKALAGVLSPVGTLIKQGRKTLAGTLTPTGATAAFRVTLRAFSGVVAPAGTLAKTLGKVAAGSITPAGVLAALKTTLLSLVGVLRPTAATVITGQIVPIVPNGLGVTVQTANDHSPRTMLETEG